MIIAAAGNLQSCTYVDGGCIAVQKVPYVLGLVRLPVKTETNYGDVCWRRYLAKASAASLLGFFDENP
jgi:hypothetical protein